MDVVPACADSRFPATNVCYRNPFRVLPCEWGGRRCQLFTAWVVGSIVHGPSSPGWLDWGDQNVEVNLHQPLQKKKAMCPIPEVKGVSFGLHLGWTGWFQVVSFPKIAGNQCSLGQQRRVFGGALEAFGDRQWSRLEFLGLFGLTKSLGRRWISASLRSDILKKHLGSRWNCKKLRGEFGCSYVH